MASDSGSSSSEEMKPIGLSEIPTLSALYKDAVLKLRATTKPRYPVKESLLDRVSLLWVVAFTGRESYTKITHTATISARVISLISK